MFLLPTTSFPTHNSLYADNPHYTYNKEPHCPRGMISRDKSVVMFWLLLDLEGLREGTTSGILNKLSEWCKTGTGIVGHQQNDFPYCGQSE